MDYSKIKSKPYFTIALEKEDWRTILRALKAESETTFIGSTDEQYEQYHTEIAQIQNIIRDKLNGNVD